MAAKCPICGAPMENGSCGYCGYSERSAPAAPAYAANAPVQPAPQPVQQVIINNQASVAGMPFGVSQKSKITALLLCIFLGGLGAHRFYVGKIGTGILYLFTMGLFGIGWLVDIFLIATGSFKDDFNLPLKQ